MTEKQYQLVVEYTRHLWPGETIAILVSDGPTRDRVEKQVDRDLWQWQVVVMATGDELPEHISKAFVSPDVDQETQWFQGVRARIEHPETNVAVLPTDL